MSQMILIKAGTTFPNTVREYGDFDTWTCRGLGLSPDQVRLFDVSRDSELPAPEQCSGVVITGSHAMVTDDADWSERLVEWIAHLLEARVPFLGICYGHQLLAKAAGGAIGNHPDGPEIGTVAIDCLPASSSDPLFRTLPTSFYGHVTHFQTVLTLPPHITRLAANAYEPHHAIRVGDCAWGLQFHPEFDSQIMHAYISEQSEGLQAAGMSVVDLDQSVRLTPIAASILRNFAEICQGRVALSSVYQSMT